MSRNLQKNNWYFYNKLWWEVRLYTCTLFIRNKEKSREKVLLSKVNLVFNVKYAFYVYSSYSTNDDRFYMNKNRISFSRPIITLKLPLLNMAKLAIIDPAINTFAKIVRIIPSINSPLSVNDPNTTCVHDLKLINIKFYSNMIWK